MNVSPTLLDVYVAVQAFLAAVTGLDQSLVIKGLPNRASMPLADPGFITMQAVRSRRLRTNVTSWENIADPATLQVEQGTELEIQIDCYGAASPDWVAAISTLWRDAYGCDALAPVGAPLYIDEGMMAPLDDTEEQYEERWVLRGIMQYNPVVSPPQQFFNELTIKAINADERYPPG